MVAVANVSRHDPPVDGCIKKSRHHSDTYACIKTILLPVLFVTRLCVLHVLSFLREMKDVMKVRFRNYSVKFVTPLARCATPACKSFHSGVASRRIPRQVGRSRDLGAYFTKVQRRWALSAARSARALLLR